MRRTVRKARSPGPGGGGSNCFDLAPETKELKQGELTVPDAGRVRVDLAVDLARARTSTAEHQPSKPLSARPKARPRPKPKPSRTKTASAPSPRPPGSKPAKTPEVKFRSGLRSVVTKEQCPEDRLFPFERLVDSIQYIAQGDPSLYTPTLMGARRALLNDKRIVKAIDLFWNTYEKNEDNCISFSDYVIVQVKIRKALISEKHFNIEESKDIAIKDWIRDVKEPDPQRVFVCGMNYEKFKLSIFELVDIWTDTIEATDYVDFLEKLYERITVPADETSSTHHVAYPNAHPITNPLQFVSLAKKEETHLVEVLESLIKYQRKMSITAKSGQMRVATKSSVRHRTKSLHVATKHAAGSPRKQPRTPAARLTQKQRTREVGPTGKRPSLISSVAKRKASVKTGTAPRTAREQDEEDEEEGEDAEAGEEQMTEDEESDTEVEDLAQTVVIAPYKKHAKPITVAELAGAYVQGMRTHTNNHEVGEFEHSDSSSGSSSESEDEESDATISTEESDSEVEHQQENTADESEPEHSPSDDFSHVMHTRAHRRRKPSQLAPTDEIIKPITLKKKKKRRAKQNSVSAYASPEPPKRVGPWVVPAHRGSIFSTISDYVSLSTAEVPEERPPTAAQVAKQKELRAKETTWGSSKAMSSTKLPSVTPPAFVAKAHPRIEQSIRAFNERQRKLIEEDRKVKGLVVRDDDRKPWRVGKLPVDERLKPSLPRRPPPISCTEDDPFFFATQGRNRIKAEAVVHIANPNLLPVTRIKPSSAFMSDLDAKRRDQEAQRVARRSKWQRDKDEQPQERDHTKQTRDDSNTAHAQPRSPPHRTDRIGSATTFQTMTVPLSADPRKQLTDNPYSRGAQPSRLPTGSLKAFRPPSVPYTGDTFGPVSSSIRSDPVPSVERGCAPRKESRCKVFHMPDVLRFDDSKGEWDEVKERAGAGRCRPVGPAVERPLTRGRKDLPEYKAPDRVWDASLPNESTLPSLERKYLMSSAGVGRVHAQVTKPYRNGQMDPLIVRLQRRFSDDATSSTTPHKSSHETGGSLGLLHGYRPFTSQTDTYPKQLDSERDTANTVKRNVFNRLDMQLQAQTRQPQPREPILPEISPRSSAPYTTQRSESPSAADESSSIDELTRRLHRSTRGHGLHDTTDEGLHLLSALNGFVQCSARSIAALMHDVKH